MPTWGHQSLEYQNSKLKFSDFDAGGATSELWCAWPTVCSWGPENFGKDAPTRYQWGQKVRSHWRFWPQKGYSLGFADLILSYLSMLIIISILILIYLSIDRSIHESHWSAEPGFVLSILPGSTWRWTGGAGCLPPHKLLCPLCGAMIPSSRSSS